MATANQAVTADGLISATVKYSNKDDDNRIYDISANVNISNGKVSTFDGGVVRIPKNTATRSGSMAPEATFNSYSEKAINLSIDNADAEDARSILDSIYVFMADVRANVTANPVQA